MVSLSSVLATLAAIGCLLHTHHINHLAAVAAAGLIGLVSYKIDSAALAADSLPVACQNSIRGRDLRFRSSIRRRGGTH
jgi:hypothetical protein